MSFSVAVSGLNAAHKRLEVAGNNIANVGTTGFKASRAEFSAVYSSAHLGGGANAVGDGVRLANVSQDFSSGGVDSSSGRPLDMRIQGQGFFVVSDDGAISYTRAGAFIKDANDFVVDAHGSRLQGYAANDKGEIVSGVRSDLKIDTGNLSPKATTEVSQTLNLDSAAASLAVVPTFNPADPATYTRVTTRTIQDQGVPEIKEVKGLDAAGNPIVVIQGKPAIAPADHVLKQYLVKTDNDQWTSYLLIDGRNPLDPSSPSPLHVGLRTHANGALAIVGANPAVQRVSDTELALGGWVPAVQQSGVWGPSGAAGGGVKLSLVDGGAPLLDPADALMPRSLPAFDPTDINTYSAPFTSQLYDSLGNRHELTQHYVKHGSNSWRLNVLVNGRNPQDPSSTEPMSASLLFGSDGSLLSLTGAQGLVASEGKLTLQGWVPAQPSPHKASGPWVSNGAVGNVDGIVLDMSQVTQHRAETSRSSVNSDGHAPGEINGLSIDKNGMISAGFSNGLHRSIGQVMLADFNNQQGLRPLSDTRWAQTHGSGEPNYGTPGSGTLGRIVAHSLEGSNVKLTEELVELIQAQTAYQANSKTLSTEAELMQTLIRAT